MISYSRNQALFWVTRVKSVRRSLAFPSSASISLCALWLFVGAWSTPAQNVSVVYAAGASDIAVVNSTALAVDRTFSLIRSDDGGMTWSSAPFDTSRVPVSVVSCPTGSFIVGTTDGLYESKDGGDSWAILPAIQGPFNFPNIRCLDSGDILVAEGSYIWRYSRAENDFVVAKWITENGGGESVIGLGPSDIIRVGYTGCLESSCGGLFVSADSGETFSKDITWIGAAVGSILTMDSARVYVRSFDSAWLFDDGQWVVAADPGVHRSVYLGSGLIYAVSEIGVFRSEDAGLNWSTVWNTTGAEDIALAADTSLLVATSTSILRITNVYATSLEPSERQRGELAFDAYPNPFKDKLMIRIGSSGYLWIEILDLAGRRVVHVRAIEGLIEMRTDALPTGSYFVRLCQNGSCSSRHLLKTAR